MSRQRKANPPSNDLIRYVIYSLVFTFAAAVVATMGCRPDGDGRRASEVVVYCSVDEEFARDILRRFEQQSGVTTRAVFDSEAGKTTGLVNRIMAESANPRADVLWSSELFNTIRLGREGLLASYRSPSAADIPDRYKDGEGLWTAIGLRGRVLAFNPNKIDRDALPRTWHELSQPEWASRAALANPLFGTTGGHVAAMFATWGHDAGRTFLADLVANGIVIADGNSTAVRMLAAGQVDLCATDTDDVWVAQRQGLPVDLIYPDLGDGGTLWIPNSVALVAGCRHPEAGRKLIDFLVSAEVERLLAGSASGNIPVRPELRRELGLVLPPASQVSYDRVADAMADALEQTREILLR